MISWLANNASWLSAAGVLWDISGGILLSKGLLMSDEQVTRRSGSYFGMSPPALRGLCEQRIDARLGMYQLLFGFLLQFFSAVGFKIDIGLAIVLCLPAAMLWHFYYRNFKYWTACASLRLQEGEATEQVWRTHFSDVSDSEWRNAVASSRARFAEPPP